MRFSNTWINATIVDVKKVAARVKQIIIQPESRTYSYTPGAHINVEVLINDLPKIRNYSLVGKHQNGAPYTIAVKKVESSRGGSEYMWRLNAGDKVKITQPTNNFELSYTASDYLLIAGGIGITPIIGMAEELITNTDLHVKMIYIDKAISDMSYLQKLSKLLGNRLTIHNTDEKGRFNIHEIINYASPSTHVYLCGPLGLMNAVRSAWEKSGYEHSNLRFETFGVSGSYAPQDFKVKIPRFGIELMVPANQTLLETLESEGINIMYDCKKGECGLCQVDILDCSGHVDHRDFFFSEEQKSENTKMCACVSRVASGDLVIDTAYRG